MADDRVTDVLTAWWRDFRDDSSRDAILMARGAVEMCRRLGLVTDLESEGWLARFARCPGHDDEGGRSWCAYGCPMPDEEAARG